MRNGSRASGFTYVWMLATLLLLSIGAAAVAQRWTEEVKRQREADLLRVGTLYALAFESYYNASPGSLRRYPLDLKDLLEDDRMIGTVRYLRALYADPLDPSRSWGLVRSPDGGIMGVYSQSEDEPFRSEPLIVGNTTLSAARRYSEWKFTAQVAQ